MRTKETHRAAVERDPCLQTVSGQAQAAGTAGVGANGLLVCVGIHCGLSMDVDKGWQGRRGGASE